MIHRDWDAIAYVESERVAFVGVQAGRSKSWTVEELETERTLLKRLEALGRSTVRVDLPTDYAIDEKRWSWLPGPKYRLRASVCSPCTDGAHDECCDDLPVAFPDGTRATFTCSCAECRSE